MVESSLWRTRCDKGGTGVRVENGEATGNAEMAEERRARRRKVGRNGLRDATLAPFFSGVAHGSLQSGRFRERKVYVCMRVMILNERASALRERRREEREERKEREREKDPAHATDISHLLLLLSKRRAACHRRPGSASKEGALSILA